jgi:hypothetical protein
MSNNNVMIFFTLSAFFFLVRHFYITAVRPYLLRRERYKIFALRDELRTIQMSRKFSPAELRAIRYMENTLSGALQVSEALRLGDFFIATIKARRNEGSEKARKKFEEFSSHRPEEILVLDKRFCFSAVKIMMFNSPIVTAAVIPIYCLRRLSSYSGRWQEVRQGLSSFAHVAPCHDLCT